MRTALWSYAGADHVIKPKGGGLGHPLTRALIHSLALPLSPARRSRVEKGSSIAVVVPSLAVLATYTAPPLDSSHPQLHHVAH